MLVVKRINTGWQDAQRLAIVEAAIIPQTGRIKGRNGVKSGGGAHLAGAVVLEMGCLIRGSTGRKTSFLPSSNIWCLSWAKPSRSQFGWWLLKNRMRMGT